MSRPSRLSARKASENIQQWLAQKSDDDSPDEDSDNGNESSDEDDFGIIDRAELHIRQDDMEEYEDSENGGDEQDMEVAESDKEFVSKDGQTKWSAKPPCRRRAVAANIVHVPGTGMTKQGVTADSAVESFQHFITEQTIENIVLHTNEKGSLLLGDRWKETDRIEMAAYIGLLLLAGVFRSNHQNFHELWEEKYGSPLFRATMTKNRFRHLTRCIRFDDTGTRANRKTADKFAPIRDVFEDFVANCRTKYEPNVEVTIDEQFVSFPRKSFVFDLHAIKTGQVWHKILATL